MTGTLTFRPNQGLTSADSVKPTGEQTPADALGVTKRMHNLDDETNQSDGAECPTCGDTFDKKHGMRVHHSRVHGESIAYTERECEYCGDTFTVKKSYIERGDGRFCSQHCFGKQNFDGDTLERECELCGKPFMARKARVDAGGAKYCSGACYGQWLSQNNVGENHPRWKGGYTEYRGTHWPKLRHRVIKSHRYQCANCGRDQEDHRDEYGVGLHCHHVEPVTSFDKPIEADTVDNLVPLCRDCHLDEHSKN